jgi:hypothetical protein
MKKYVKVWTYQFDRSNYYVKIGMKSNGEYEKV